MSLEEVDIIRKNKLKEVGNIIKFMLEKVENVKKNKLEEIDTKKL